jgi:uncharacterized membrane protein YdjX (TVP38/TMEM64 family)
MATPSDPGESSNSVTSWRRAALAFVLFGGLGVLFLFGLPMLGLSGPAEARRLLTLAQGPYALPAVIVAFAVLAFLGVPQVALIAAAVLAFGPWTGLAYSWVGTMASSLAGFGLGQAFGGRLIADWPQARRFAELVGRNGFVASLVVRLVPFAPFVLVNVAAGVTPMSWAAFTLGTAIGILPKIAVIAFAGHSVMAGGTWALVWLVLALAVWGLAGLAARRWLRH